MDSAAVIGVTCWRKRAFDRINSHLANGLCRSACSAQVDRHVLNGGSCVHTDLLNDQQCWLLQQAMTSVETRDEWNSWLTGSVSARSGTYAGVLYIDQQLAPGHAINQCFWSVHINKHETLAAKVQFPACDCHYASWLCCQFAARPI